MPVELSVVAPSHARPLRLRWLLNALEEQTLAPDRWEVIIGHDADGEETEELLRTHPLGRRVALRSVRSPAGTALPGINRNRAWRAATSELILFTDDDCRPPADWLERALEAARRHPGAVVQGSTAPDLEETVIGQHAAHVHTVSIWPPQPWGQSCNILYPRSVLEAVGGFPEDLWLGEDTALAEMARARGVAYVGAPEVVTYHAITEVSVLRAIRGSWRARDLPLMVRRYPRLREESPLWIFWTREHALLPLAALGWWQLHRSRLALLLMLPYVAQATPKKHHQYARGRIRAALELPGWAVLHAGEIVTLAWGSIKHRSIYL